MWLSVFGHTVGSSTGFFASVWQEYSKADSRWAVADPGVVSVEILTVIGGGSLAAYAAYLVSRGDARYHFWIVVLCTAELYGDFMTFVPEWLVGSPSLNGSNPLFLWVYLTLSNGCVTANQCMGMYMINQVVIPFYLLVTSGQHLLRKQHVKAE